MKKYISIIIFCAAAFLSLGAGVFSIAPISTLAESHETYSAAPPEDLSGLQSASAGQLHFAFFAFFI